MCCCTKTMNTNELQAAVERLRLAADALRFLSSNIDETMAEASAALAAAQEAIESVRAPPRITQVAAGEGGELFALANDGSLWQHHRVRDLDMWDQLSLPSEDG
jgi:H+/gluconate symporter-like permease